MTEGTSAKSYFNTILSVQSLDASNILLAKQIFEN